MSDGEERGGDGPGRISIPAYAVARGIDAATLPRSVRIVLEAALRGAAAGAIEPETCETILRWRPGGDRNAEWRFPIGRVLMQDASGLPLLADLAALRDALAARGVDPAHADLAVPAALVIDHSIDADHWGSRDALARNMAAEFARNSERYAFARWAEQAFAGLAVVPPGNGIVHQVHLERLAELVSVRDGEIVCDSVIGTDSHTTMVGGLGILGWGVGGIEAEAALLGQPLSIAAPDIVGVELVGAPQPGVFGADLALALTARLRGERVVGAFLEFHGPGVAALDVADRNSIANMAPEYGATLALFPIDEATIAYLRRHGRPAERLAQARAHLERQGLFGTPGSIAYDRVIRFDLGAVEPSVAGPTRPDQLVPLGGVAEGFRTFFAQQKIDGRVALAAITSCTNTANLRSIVAAGLLARAAVGAGIAPPSWVKTVFAPGSRATTTALDALGLTPALDALGFTVAAYGCGPCVGNTGALADGIEQQLGDGAVAAAVLSGNRNFEGRIHRAIRAAYLMSPALVVAYALAGRIDHDLTTQAFAGTDVRLADIWPTSEAIDAALARLDGGEAAADWHRPDQWSALPAAGGMRYGWDARSTFFVPPPFFARDSEPVRGPLIDARPLLLLGDAVTTDHISPVGAIGRDSAAASYLDTLGVGFAQAGSYSARRVNHEVMLRGTFANPRLRNALVAEAGPVTRTMPGGPTLPVHEAAATYGHAGIPVVVLAGHDYGAGSARDWAAKGTALLGIRAVLAQSFERIHRSNLVALGVLPIAVAVDDPWAGIGPASDVRLSIALPPELRPAMALNVRLTVDGAERVLPAILRVATEAEARQLAQGTMFDHCLEMVLAKAA